MNKNEIVTAVKDNKRVIVNLTDAEVVFVGRETTAVGYNRPGQRRFITRTKIIVLDKELGSVFFSGYSEKFRNLRRGDKVSLKATITGVGTPSQKYPDPILFAKVNTRRRGEFNVATPAA